MSNVSLLKRYTHGFSGVRLHLARVSTQSFWKRAARLCRFLAFTQARPTFIARQWSHKDMLLIASCSARTTSVFEILKFWLVILRRTFYTWQEKLLYSKQRTMCLRDSAQAAMSEVLLAYLLSDDLLTERNHGTKAQSTRKVGALDQKIFWRN